MNAVEVNTPAPPPYPPLSTDPRSVLSPGQVGEALFKAVHGWKTARMGWDCPRRAPASLFLVNPLPSCMSVGLHQPMAKILRDPVTKLFVTGDAKDVLKALAPRGLAPDAFQDVPKVSAVALRMLGPLGIVELIDYHLNAAYDKLAVVRYMPLYRPEDVVKKSNPTPLVGPPVRLILMLAQKVLGRRFNSSQSVDPPVTLILMLAKKAVDQKANALSPVGSLVKLVIMLANKVIDAKASPVKTEMVQEEVEVGVIVQEGIEMKGKGKGKEKVMEDVKVDEDKIDGMSFEVKKRYSHMEGKKPELGPVKKDVSLAAGDGPRTSYNYESVNQLLHKQATSNSQANDLLPHTELCKPDSRFPTAHAMKPKHPSVKPAPASPSGSRDQVASGSRGSGGSGSSDPAQCSGHATHSSVQSSPRSSRSSASEAHTAPASGRRSRPVHNFGAIHQLVSRQIAVNSQPNGSPPRARQSDSPSTVASPMRPESSSVTSGPVGPSAAPGQAASRSGNPGVSVSSALMLDSTDDAGPSASAGVTDSALDAQSAGLSGSGSGSMSSGPTVRRRGMRAVHVLKPNPNASRVGRYITAQQRAQQNPSGPEPVHDDQ